MQHDYHACMRLLLAAVVAFLALLRPIAATWSIILIDRRTGEIAVASATCLPNFDLAVWVPIVLVGKGAGCAQSFVDPTGNTRIYIRDQLALGTTPSQIIAGLATRDPGHQTRQYGVADVLGRAVGFTGTGAGAYASDRIGQVGDIVYAVQGNVLTGGAVLAAAEIAIYTTPGDLGEKMMAAMEAARRYGGDGRCSCSEGAPTSCGSPPPNFTKSADVAFMIVARPGDVDGTCNATVGCASGTYYMRLNVANRLRSDPDPVILLRGLYDQWRTQQRGRPDHFLSTFTFSSPSLPLNGQTVVNGRLVLRDREGTRITSGVTAQVAIDPASTTNATLGPVRDNGDGTFDVPITAGTTQGQLVLQVDVNDGTSTRRIGPRPTLPTTSINDRIWVSRATVSATSGGAVDFSVQPGAFFGANRTWLLMGTLSGTRPGIILPPFYNLPLNPDPIFHVLLQAAVTGLMPELVGRTSGLGVAATSIRFPPGMYALPVGANVSFAYALISPITLASEAVTFRITM
jgi:uncharacterized Ntn-hydrolase superfamily protein